MKQKTELNDDRTSASRTNASRERQGNGRKAVRHSIVAASARLSSCPREAAMLAEAALTAAQSLNDALLQGESALLLAQCYAKGADLARASDAIDASVSAFEKAGNSDRLGAAYKLRAQIFGGQERYSLALAAASKALSCSYLPAKDRAILYHLIGACFTTLFDPCAGLAVIEGRALPEADRSRDSTAINSVYSRTAALLRMCAIWSSDIPHYLTVGMQRPTNLEPPAAYLARATECLRVCELHGIDADHAERGHFLALKAGVVSMQDGFEAARPIFMQAHAAASDKFPRSKVLTLLIEGTMARVAGRWSEALAALLAAQSQSAASLGERLIMFELTHVYRALGRPDDALHALERFTSLHANMARLASSWIKDSPNQRRYGKQLDLARLHLSVMNPVEPIALKRANLYVEKHIGRRLTLPEVARQAGVSVRTLYTLYRNSKGVSPSSFIKERRMLRAYEMLDEERIPVERVAEAIGYSSAANFSRDFRKRYGQAPSEIRCSSSSDE